MTLYIGRVSFRRGVSHYPQSFTSDLKLSETETDRSIIIICSQKCFTTDFLTKSRKVNEGEVPQYYIEHSHEAIIIPEEWDAVQDELARRKHIGNAYSGKSVFGAKIKCGDCGA